MADNEAGGNADGVQPQASALGLTLHPSPAEATDPASAAPAVTEPAPTDAPKSADALSEPPKAKDSASNATEGTTPGDAAEPAKESEGDNIAAPASPEEPKSPTERGARKPRRGANDYINPDRVKTGGQRDKPSEDELTERMARIKLQNEKILARREQTDRDAEAYEKTMAQEREAAKQRRRVQQEVNTQRMENARRKMGNMAGREWDAGKDAPQQHGPPNTFNEERGRGRGGRGRGPRGGRGGFQPRGAPPHMDAPSPPASTPSGPAPADNPAPAATFDTPDANDWTQGGTDWTQG